MSNEIDAGAELDRLDADHGRSTLENHKKPMAKGIKGVLICGLALGMAFGAFFVVQAVRTLKASEVQAAEGAASSAPVKIGSVGREFTPAAPVPEPAPEPVAAVMPEEAAPVAPASAPSYGQEPVPTDPAHKSPEQLLKERRLGASFGGSFDNGNADGSGGQPAPAPASGGASGSGELADKMTPIRLNAAGAGLLGNRDLLITQGAMIDCQLETKLVTTQAGQVSCYLTRDVRSTSGRVVLLEKGTLVVGQYQGGITQGQARIFVLWTRAETPKGVIINLDSSGAGPLGEAGLGGWVDTHFWERFGGAIMLSVIGDIGDFVTRKASEGGEDRITFENTSEGGQDMAAEALRNTINIPPTLYKNHGERLQIFVARDLDFSEVYSLERN